MWLFPACDCKTDTYQAKDFQGEPRPYKGVICSVCNEEAGIGFADGVCSSRTVTIIGTDGVKKTTAYVLLRDADRS